MSKFFHCYLLNSKSEPASTYIGFTTHPMRRIRQHNGEIKAGAFRTRKKRPWEMIAVVYGFSDKIAALQFEWAWQHPNKSRLVRNHVTSLGRKRGPIAKFELLCKLMTLDPWCRLPLKLHLVRESLYRELSKFPALPEHIYENITCGGLDALEVYFKGIDMYSCSDDEESDEENVKSLNTSAEFEEYETCEKKKNDSFTCKICFSDIPSGSKFATCPSCHEVFHLKCLSNCLLVNKNDLLPTKGLCPNLNCKSPLNWADIASIARFSSARPAIVISKSSKTTSNESSSNSKSSSSEGAVSVTLVEETVSFERKKKEIIDLSIIDSDDEDFFSLSLKDRILLKKKSLEL